MSQLNYFKMKEFVCNCGCKQNKMKFDFLVKLDLARSYTKVWFIILRGYSCENHPLTKENPTSSHPKGNAVDIKFRNSFECWEIVEALKKAGFKRIGINNGGIHVDSDEEKESPRLWNYYKK